MAQWQLHLDLPYYHDYPDKLSLTELAKKITEALKFLQPSVEKKFPDELFEFEDVVLQFDLIDDDSTVEDFDYAMEGLYDWADTPVGNNGNWSMAKKLCWVNTWATRKEEVNG
jgi:hypothetical protein